MLKRFMNPALPTGPSYSYKLNASIHHFRGVLFIRFYHCIGIIVNFKQCLDPDKTLRSLMSDLGLH